MKELNLFEFGKYKGSNIADIWKTDQGYIKWCLNHVENFILTPEIIKQINIESTVSTINIQQDLKNILKNSKVGDVINSFDGKEICGNITHLKLSDKVDDCDVIAYKEVGKDKWTVAKVGKVVNRIIKENLLGFTNSDVESFVNSYKARLNMKNVNFELVEGLDVRKFYHQDNYENLGGTLNNSCMKYDGCQGYLKLYTKNKKFVNLLILRNKNSKKIIGRAIVWLDTTISSKGSKIENVGFMDRIYYCSDYQVNLFIEYAKSKGWAYKSNQSHDISSPVIYKDKTYMNPFIKATIKDWDFDKYPYVDTIPYIWKNGVISNKEPWVTESTTKDVDCAVLRNTDGGRSNFYNYSY